ncbi:MAG: helix-turn-helix domain-containing protein [Fibrobacteria bacterium]|nr:helix-turn-helix domain-containing protein [Fibrobacteria bacterium]
MLNINEEFRQQIKKLRKAAGYSQLDFSQKAGISSGYYAAIESGAKSNNPTLDIIVRIANTLNIKIVDLFREIELPNISNIIDHIYSNVEVFHQTYKSSDIDDAIWINSNIENVCQQYRFNHDDIKLILDCFSRLYKNALEHGNKNSDNKKITTTCFINYESIKIKIQDEGMGFDVLSKKSSGGIAYTKKHMDYIKHSLGGSCVEFSKTKDNDLSKKNTAFYHLFYQTILNWADIFLFNTKYLTNHLHRMPLYVEELCQNLKSKDPQCENYFSADYIRDIKLASMLHDIGNMGLDANLLNKKARLSGDDMNAIKQHVIIGADLLSTLKEKWSAIYPGTRSIFDLAEQGARFHHEQWDGQGYIQRRKGKEIPFSARAIRLCDTYDALTSDRPYRPKMSHDKATTIIEASKRQFAPELVDSFFNVKDVFKDIKKTNADKIF